MSLESALVYLLSQDAGVSALVGDRIDPGQTPQRRTAANASTDPGSFPHIQYRRISTPERIKSQDGAGPLTRAIVRFWCWGLSADDAAAVREAILNATLDGQRLHGWKQTMMGDCYVNACWLEGDAASDIATAEAEALGQFLEYIDADCWYREE